MPKLFLCLLLSCVLVARANEVKLEGVSALPGYPVRVLVYDDLISGWQVELASTTSDFKGSFALRFSLRQPAWITLAVAQYRADLFAVPGGKYMVQTEMKRGESAAFYDPPPLSVKTLSAADGGLSDAIAMANVVYNAFVVEHFNALYRLQQTKLIDTLRQVLRRTIPDVDHQYFKDYVFYKVASLEPAVRKLSPSLVYERFFKNRPVLADQPEYVSLLRETFKNYLIQHKLWTQQEYAEALTKGWKAFDKLLQRDTMLAENRAFRELLVLIHFAEHFHHPLHRSADLSRLLSTIAATSPVPEHARIAANIIRKAERLLPGSYAPRLLLRDESGTTLEINESAPAMLLIFVGPDCRYCEYELLQLREIHGRMGRQFKFVTISLHESRQHYRSIHQRNKLDWPVFSLGSDYRLLDAYDAKVFPHYVILMPGAKIGMVPAPPTDQRLEQHLQRLARQL
ncbi:MAG TPA: hypothetical protein PKE03_00895 [Bacteroidales bacterium]|nr:hypothetical protein [Bacteroidales bacterium]